MEIPELLAGKAAFVTGGAQGIGLAIGAMFAAAGAQVTLADRDGEAAAAAAAGVPGARGVRCDVTSEDEVQRAVQEAAEAFGSLDCMVNNAGITRDATLRKLGLDDFRAVVDVHLVGAWLGTRAAAEVMRGQGSGSIVNMSSISGKIGIPGQTNYSAAKAAIVGMTKAAAKELGRSGVRVNAVQPGLIRTAMTAALKPEVFAAKEAEIPLGRAGEPDDVAKVVLFLASDLSDYLTGNVIEVAGGRAM